MPLKEVHMSNELVRRMADSVGLAPVSRRLPAHVVRAVDAASHHGLKAAAKVQAAGFVTHVALTQVAMLTAEEARLIESCPLAEQRNKVLVDTFTGVAAAEIAHLSY